jgi:hypothetical protein
MFITFAVPGVFELIFPSPAFRHTFSYQEDGRPRFEVHPADGPFLVGLTL